MKNNIAARVVSILIAAVMLFATFGMLDGSFAAKKNRIVFQNIDSNFVLQKGKKYKIKVKQYGKAAKYRVRYKSSSKKIATVSKKGVIKGKKKGTVKITAYVKIKGKKRYKKTVKIRIGARVSSVKVTGSQSCVRVGKSISLKRTCLPSSARNKNVRWYSSDNAIATVSSKGTVKGVKEGYARIYAKALDGSGALGSFRMHVYKGFRKSDALWVAHRGLHTGYAENTAGAFIAAGEAGFWGAECDVRETRHVMVPVEQDPESVDAGDGDDPDPPAPPEPEYVEDCDLVINHDESFKRVFGVSANVKDMTAEDIQKNSKLAGRVCFLRQYLDICYRYDMVPAIEMKDSEMSDLAVEKMVGMVWDTGLQLGGSEAAGRAFLKRVDWISFYSGNLRKVKNYISSVEEYQLAGKAIMTTYLVNPGSQKVALEKIDVAKKAMNDYNVISIDKKDIFPAFVDKCKREGLLLDIWTFENKAADWDALHDILKHSGYGPAHITVDFRPW